MGLFGNASDASVQVKLIRPKRKGASSQAGVEGRLYGSHVMHAANAGMPTKGFTLLKRS